MRTPRTLPRILEPAEVDALIGGAAHPAGPGDGRGDGAGRAAPLRGPRAAAGVICRSRERRVFIADGKGGHQRLVPMSPVLHRASPPIWTVNDPPDADTDRLFVVLKGPRRGQPLSAAGLDRSSTAPGDGPDWRTATCHELRHTCLTRLREAGMALEAVQAQAGHASIESTRIYLHLAETGWPRSTGARPRPSTPRSSPASRPSDRPVCRDGAGERPASGCRPGQLDAAAPADGGDDAPLPGPARPACCGPAASRGADLALRSLRRVPGRARTRRDQRRRRRPSPYRGLQPLARGPARTAHGPGHTSHAARTGSARCGCSSCASANGAGPTRRPGCRSFAGDLPRQDQPLPKALDDAAAAKLLRAAQNRAADAGPGRRRSACCAPGCGSASSPRCAADAVVLIGAGHWLHVPVGKLHDDRYLPLHPHLVTSSATTAAAHVPPSIRCCCPGENGRAAGPAHRHPADQQGRRRRRARRTSTPTSSATPWPPRPSTAA